MSRRRSVLAIAALAPLLARVGASGAAETAAAFPSRPVHVIVPLAAGGAMEVMGRMVGDRLARQWGQAVVVEARPGGNGMIGAGAVLQSPADGYTLLFTSSGLMQNAHLRPNSSIRLDRFTPVGMIAYSPVAFAIQAAIPATTLQEFVDHVRARPGKVSYGSYGVGSSGHILGEMLNKVAGLDMVHVPYKGESAAVQDLLGGQVAAIFGAAGSLARQAGSKVRVLAVGSPQRLSSYPDIPTFADAGYASVNLAGWAAVFVPAGTPPGVVAKISEDLVRIGALPEVKAWLAKEGFEPSGLNAAEFATFLKADYERWGDVIRRSLVTVD